MALRHRKSFAFHFVIIVGSLVMKTDGGADERCLFLMSANEQLNTIF